MDRLAVGRIGGAHGLQGALKVKSLSGETGHFFRLERVYVLGAVDFEEYRVDGVKPYRSGVLLKLEGVDTPEQADKLRGHEVWVERANASVLGEGEYYLADLCRCRVYQAEREIGVVVSVCEGGNAELLEVERPSGERVIVPFLSAFVGEVDVESGSIHLTAGFELP
ncbi:MAG: 16S rRNA processing protein RimM [Spirochaetales bacterium]|nr:16S rRNA processing protein RimM [Spirochaetales bacterium]